MFSLRTERVSKCWLTTMTTAVIERRRKITTFSSRSPFSILRLWIIKTIIHLFPFLSILVVKIESYMKVLYTEKFPSVHIFDVYAAVSRYRRKDLCLIYLIMYEVFARIHEIKMWLGNLFEGKNSALISLNFKNTSNFKCSLSSSPLNLPPCLISIVKLNFIILT